MSRPRPPFGLRLIQLRDRIVLHDLTYALKNADPSSRNALIDAANSVHARSTSPKGPPTEDLLSVDLPTPPSSTTTAAERARNRYLVLPFAKSNSRSPPPPFEASSPAEAGFTPGDTSFRVDVVPAFIGLLPLHTAMFAVFVTHIRPAASLPSGAVFSAAKVTLVPLSPSLPSKEDKEAAMAVSKLLESGSILYSLYTDISNPAHGSPPNVKRPFHWNFPLVNRMPQPFRCWAPICIYGFVATHHMRIHIRPPTSTQARNSWTSSDFLLTLISRRSRRRAGTRYITRGVDAMGDVANFVETEQLVWRPDNSAISSFLIIRGSIPVFWRQDNGIARPAPQLDGPLVPSRRAFARHFETLRLSYTRVAAVSLVDFHGSEGVLARAFSAHADLFTSTSASKSSNHSSEYFNLVPFDFHAMCSGKEYERGLANLLDQIRTQINKFGFFARTSEGITHEQTGVFRVNCVDCLDRTNVVQSLIARVVLGQQLSSLFFPSNESKIPQPVPGIDQESEDRFKHVWGDNADAISKQYSGTGALKTDFTRTGKRSTTGVIGDGVKSVMRMYYKNFVDEGRQEVIDILCGNAVVRQQAEAGTIEINNLEIGQQKTASSSAKSRVTEVQDESAKPKPKPGEVSSLWYSFDAMRINAGGDRQSVYVELHDEAMYVTTVDGICFEYPRKALLTWSKQDEGKLMDKKTPSRLRLNFRGSHANPPTASPLDLQFRGGSTARENFLRAFISWSKPEVSNLLAKHDVRVRMLASTEGGEHCMRDWGLDDGRGQTPQELIALVVPSGGSTARSNGLMAVPVDVDSSRFVTVAACSVGTEGPAVAVLATKEIALSVMTVNEDCVESNSSNGLGGAAAVSVDACGSTFCFVSLRQPDAADIPLTLSSLKLGRQTADITNQFHHTFVGGLFGNAKWSAKDEILCGPAGRKWNCNEDGSLCYSLDNGLSAIRSSFQTLRYEDELSSESLWRENKRETSRGYVALAEGIVDGRSGPRLPKEPCHCVVTVSNFRGEDIQLPRGVEPSAQLSSVVVLNSEHASLEGAVSKQMARPISYPECREPLQIPIIPSDIEEVLSSFLFGQIAIPTTLGEPIPAGHFVLPLSILQNGKPIQMEAPIRIGGQRTGRVFCTVRLDASANDLPAIRSVRNRSRTKSEHIGVRDMTIAHQTQGPVAKREQPEAPDSLQRANSSVADRIGGYASTIRNTSIDDVNDRLDAARKKGAKQMKSVVSRLSSFLNQPSSSSSSGTSVPPSMTSSAAFSSLPNGLPPSMRAGKHTGLGGQTDLSDRVRDDSTRPKGTSQVQDFGQFQAGPTTTFDKTREDDLLKGLRQTSGASSRGRGRAAPAEGGGKDLLLRGLQEQQGSAPKKATEDDSWGAFESALPRAGSSDRGSSTSTNTSRDSGRRRQGQNGDGPSLIDL